MSVSQIHARMVVAVKIKMMAILVNARKGLLVHIVKQVCDTLFGGGGYFKRLWLLKPLHTSSVCSKISSRCGQYQYQYQYYIFNLQFHRTGKMSQVSEHSGE